MDWNASWKWTFITDRDMQHVYVQVYAAVRIDMSMQHGY
jgi:hypothetical protein